MPVEYFSGYSQLYYGYLFVNDIDKTEALVASFMYGFYKKSGKVYKTNLAFEMSEKLNIPVKDITNYIQHFCELGLFALERDENTKKEYYLPVFNPEEDVIYG